MYFWHILNLGHCLFLTLSLHATLSIALLPSMQGMRDIKDHIFIYGKRSLAPNRDACSFPHVSFPLCHHVCSQGGKGLRWQVPCIGSLMHVHSCPPTNMPQRIHVPIIRGNLDENGPPKENNKKMPCSHIFILFHFRRC